ncbi:MULTISPECIES: DUF2149 domain-containing protein [Caldimonas]|uniref:DUF2149 domain-containing protein n=1 Tax=Caldimonas TaxID=196013 RepID=UPI00036C530A|nr:MULTISPECIES: DUF2149 domain-containing protein [Caldimonas]MCX7659513.1 DUF2149 domain-containing protein [Caldimonas manganoxidans]GIX23576.1 MAG: hypothetical protein KatS3mg122_0807 [Caldimonas sp.]
MSLRHFEVFDEDDDPMSSAINLVDVFLVLVVALLIAVSMARQHEAMAEGDAAPDLVVREPGREVRYRGSGSTGEGQGVRAGVAYRLRDGSIVYVPEVASAPDASASR